MIRKSAARADRRPALEFAVDLGDLGFERVVARGIGAAFMC
jgi:hypothetical protein